MAVMHVGRLLPWSDRWNREVSARPRLSRLWVLRRISGLGLPLEHGFKTTLVAMRISERLGVDPATARQTYFGCLLFYGGCTADAEVQARLFPEGALLERWTPVMFGSSREGTLGVLAALAAGEGVWPARVLRAAGRLPGAVRGYKQHVAALCQVTELLAEWAWAANRYQRDVR